MQEENPIYVGIDLGTTFSSACYIDEKNGQEVIVQSSYNTSSIPSVVCFSPSCCVGYQAINNGNALNTIYEVKRFMGQKYISNENENRNYRTKDSTLLKLIENSPNKIVNINGMIGIEVERSVKVTQNNENGEVKKITQKEKIQFKPEDVSTFVLLKIKEMIERKCGKRPIKAVVGVPAMFTDNQKTATKNAMKMAGIECLNLIHEPTAAAKAYKMDNGLLYVFDFGGGTLDISIVNMQDGRGQVIMKDGDAFLGGNNIDYNIANWLKNEIREKMKKAPCFECIENIEEVIEKFILKKESKIKNEAERLKKELSKEYSTRSIDAEVIADMDSFEIFEFEAFSEYEDDVEDVNENIFQKGIKLSYKKFLELNKDIFARCEHLMKQTLTKSGKTQNDIDRVLMVGGSCKCPQIKNMLIDYFGKEKVDVSNADFDLMVVKGLARYATKISTGVSASEITTDDLLSHSIEIMITDENDQNKLHTIFPKLATIPKTERITLTNTVNNQTIIPLDVYEDEKLLGSLELKNVPPVQQGSCKIDVEFEIKLDGKLYISCHLVKPKNANPIKKVFRPSIYNPTEEELKRRAVELLKIYNGN